VDAAKRERIIVARYEWRAAEIAYTAEADKYFGDGFPDNDEITQPAEGLTTTAWDGCGGCAMRQTLRVARTGMR
jgi:hypothetical protein